METKLAVGIAVAREKIVDADGDYIVLLGGTGESRKRSRVIGVPVCVDDKQ